MISLPEIVQLPCSYSFTYADPLFCYANEMNILRAFLWGCFFPYNRFSRIFAKQYNNILVPRLWGREWYNNDSNLFTHAQIKSTLFLKILNDIVVRCYSSTERWRIACVSWNWGKSSCQDDFMDNLEDLNNLLSPTNSLKMYHGPTLIAKRALNLKAILAS